MVYGGKELAAAFRTVRKNTIQVAEDIPEEQYYHVAAPDCKAVGQMFVHVVVAADMRQEFHGRRKLNTFVGLDFLPFLEQSRAEENKPRSKAEIVELLRTQGEEFAGWMESLTPEFLSEMVTQGDGKTTTSRLEFLLSVKEHEMHHRAQLMLIERQLGIVPHLTRQSEERMAQMRAAKA
ncbi:MAG TPA: DinB family protein [Candidatus Dormibacteraeota bacterium]|nr:DinB family protein [Candidatus Dormibacteraeota bacterium]